MVKQGYDNGDDAISGAGCILLSCSALMVAVLLVVFGMVLSQCNPYG